MTNQVREAEDSAAPRLPDLVIITGMSGAGRSTAANVLEDLGWFVVDNLPPALLPTLTELGGRAQGNVPRMAAVVDVRSRSFRSTSSDSSGCTAPSLKRRRVRSVARSTASRIATTSVRRGSSAAVSSSSRSQLAVTAVKMLLKSCATPRANRASASSLLASRSRASRA